MQVKTVAICLRKILHDKWHKIRSSGCVVRLKRSSKMWVLSLFAVALLFLFPVGGGAQTVNIDFGGEEGSAVSHMIRLVALLTVLSLAPSILIMVTSFTRIIVVFSLLRSAIGLQQTPPNSVLISLALFLTAFVMMPTLQKSYDQGIAPLLAEEIDEKEAMRRTAAPFHEFMRNHVRESDLLMFLDMGKIDKVESAENIPYHVLIPAFMISELRRAFEIGFLVFVPFLIIDMMVASTLMSMGMMMLPPVLISLPFKLIFFVLVDGWAVLSESLVKSFG